MDIKTEHVNKNSWKQFTLTNDQGMSVSILNYGGIITSMVVPDKHGKLENVVLGYKNYEDYNSDPNYFGAVIGRVSGRIQDASFTLNGQQYVLEANEGKNQLHGGSNGFHQVIWEDETFQKNSTVGVSLSHTSPDGDGSYPGNLSVAVTYTLTNDNELILDYSATTDKITILTLTNHSYFNLNGNIKDTIHNHIVKVNSSQYVELDEHLIPTGKLIDVENTPFDFRNGKYLADGIDSTYDQNGLANNGYDHYFTFDEADPGEVVIKEENSGRVLTVHTDQPGIVIYTGNHLDNRFELIEGRLQKYLGVTFETQACPASLHHEGFPSVILEDGEKYQKKTVFKFSVEE